MEKQPEKSKLVPIGILLIILSQFSRLVSNAARSVDEGILRAALLLTTEALRVSFLIGIGCIIIGIIRNKKQSKGAV